MTRLRVVLGVSPSVGEGAEGQKQGDVWLVALPGGDWRVPVYWMMGKVVSALNASRMPFSARMLSGVAECAFAPFDRAFDPVFLRAGSLAGGCTCLGSEDRHIS